MFSLQKMLGKEEMIFQLLEASAEEARNSVQTLVRVSKTLDEPVVSEEFARLRQIDKKITQQIGGAVYTAFVTALAREDIQQLSIALYKIPKMVDKFAERLMLSPPPVRRVDFSTQIRLLEQATDLVVEMIRSLRKQELAKIKDLEERLQQLESEADEHIIVLYRQLYNNNRDVLQTIALKDLYEQLEKVIDRCRDAGGVVAHIALKNS